MPKIAVRRRVLTAAAPPVAVPAPPSKETAPAVPAKAAPAPADTGMANAPAPPMSNRWQGVIGIEGSPTGDGRMIEPDALGWADLPIPFRYAPVDNGGHDGAEVVGRIMTISRDGGLIRATGDFDMGSKIGCEAQRQVALGLTTGVSMDLDNIAFEYRVAADAFSSPDMMYDDYPTPGGPDTGGPGGSQVDADGRVTVMSFSPDDEMEVTTSARVRSATMVALPAFAECRIELVPAEPEEPGPDQPQAEPAPEPLPTATPGQDGLDLPSGTPLPPAVVASSPPVAPPEEWFRDPRLTEPTPLSISADGRIRGHLAEWGTCHTGYADQCVSPPTSASGYAYFRTGAVLTREGTEVPVGRITMDTRHATPDAGASGAMRHYDHTGTAVADVAAGEDGFGIWVAGAVRPGISAAKLRALRSSPLSGDWRRIGTSLELVAALAVNVPGFPIPRTSGLVASGRLQVLTAAGMVPPRTVLAPGTPGSFSEADLRHLQRLLAKERAEFAAAAARLDTTVNGPRRRAAAASLAARIGLAQNPPPPPPKKDAAPPADAPADSDAPALETDASKLPDTPPGAKPDPRYNGWVVRKGKWVFDPENDNDDDYNPDTDTDHDYWDANGNQLHPIPASPDGKQPAKPMPVQKDAAPAQAPEPPAKSAVRIRLPFASAVDDGAWDGPAAMNSCHSASDFGSIAFPRTTGEPSDKDHWALPHHSHPGAPPNAKGVASALGYFDRTQGLKDPSAAKAHLESHDKAIHAAHDKEK